MLGLNDQKTCNGSCNNNGTVDLSTYIDFDCAQILNSDGKLATITLETSSYIYSDPDVDCQLIINIPFTQTVKLNKFLITANNPPPIEASPPKTLKFFINSPTLDFSTAESTNPVHSHTIKSDKICDEDCNIRVAKFTNVSSLQVFIEDNQSEDDNTSTFINKIVLMGNPVITADVNKIKKVG